MRIGEQLEARLSDHLEARFVGMAEIVAQRAAEAADVAIASSFGSSLERMNVNVGAMEGIDSMIAETQAAAEDRLMGHIDDRMTAIARLIRSDNQALARTRHRAARGGAGARRAPEPRPGAPARDAPHHEGAAGRAGHRDGRLRSTPASARSPTSSTSETQSTAEAMIKVAEVLGSEDRPASVRVDEGYGNDLQVVDRPHERGDPRDVDGRPSGRYEQTG